jgi:dienelactone hydrolase
MSMKILLIFIVELVSFVTLQGCVLAAGNVPIAPDAPMNERVLHITVDSMDSVKLEVTLYTPNGPGPFPLAVMNHGSDGSKSPKENPRYRFTFSAYYFLSRGYAVALPMMRGYAGSEGKQVPHGCDVAAHGINNAKDIYAVINYLTSLPEIDGNNIVVAGQSFGGWNTLAFGMLKHPRVKGLINFAGGVLASDCPTPEYSLAAAAGQFGAHTSVPSIWFYGDNDKIFPTSTWRAMYDSYVAAWGPAELVAYGKFMTDSHNMLGHQEGLDIWTPKVDAFLRKVGLPSKLVHPEYLPTPFPPPTNYAAVTDIDAVPYLNDKGRKTYLKFLSDPKPKVFVFSPTGLSASFNGGFDPLGRAMNACKKYSRKCQIYAVDDHVVWSRPTPAPPPTHFASLTDQNSVPYLNDKGREGYLKFLKFRKPRAFAIAPDGAWSASSQGSDPLAVALDSCAKGHTGCLLYAVDDEIVWPGN